jgi:hypothetical protein
MIMRVRVIKSLTVSWQQVKPMWRSVNEVISLFSGRERL